MGVIATGLGSLVGAYGDKYVPPPWQQVDPLKSQQQAISGNIAAQPEAQRLASGQNMFNLDQLQGMLAAANPFFQSIKQQTAGTVQSLFDDNSAFGNAQRTAAAKAVGGGYAGSGMHGDLLARDFGMTQYQKSLSDISAGEQWLQSAQQGVPGLFDSSQMFFNPQNLFAAQGNERSLQYGASAAAAKAAALPSPEAAAWGQAFQADESSIGGLLGSAAGMGGGGSL